MMLDLDRFKSVNDSTNHLVGSYVIGEVGKLIANQCENYEGAIAARYGGDEFIITMPADKPQDLGSGRKYLFCSPRSYI